MRWRRRRDDWQGCRVLLRDGTTVDHPEVTAMRWAGGGTGLTLSDADGRDVLSYPRGSYVSISLPQDRSLRAARRSRRTFVKRFGFGRGDAGR